MFASAVLTVLALTGFNLSWSSLPVRSGLPGSAEITVLIGETDLVSVSTDSGSMVSYEITAAVDGEGFLRRAGRAADLSFPISEVLVFNSLQTGGHTVSVTFTDLESGSVNRREVEVHIDASNGALWSSAGVRVMPDGLVRASGNVTLSWRVYVPDGDSVPPAAYALLDAALKVVREGWLSEVFVDDGVVSYSADVSLSGLSRGSFRFTVAALQDEDVVASSSSSIRVLESWDIWGDVVDETKTLIRPIASAHELRELDRAGGLGDRNSVMADFWARRDPNPTTRENEYLETYLLKLDRISREFSTTGVRGINTDRGVVYAKMGEPDIIADYPFELGLYPYTTWDYFTPSLSVTFVDQDGYGYYEMVEGWDTVDRAFNAREEWSQ